MSVPNVKIITTD